MRTAAGKNILVASDISDPLAAEFGTVAEWTAVVAARLGPDYAIPAACRGSGQPAALDWLLEGLGPVPGEPLVDVGAGLGGPGPDRPPALVESARLPGPRAARRLPALR